MEILSKMRKEDKTGSVTWEVSSRRQLKADKPTCVIKLNTSIKKSQREGGATASN